MLNQFYSNGLESSEAPAFLGCFKLPVPAANNHMCRCKSPAGRLKSHQRGFWIENSYYVQETYYIKVLN